MSLFISSSRYRNRPRPVRFGLVVFIVINVIVALLPPGSVQREFEHNLARVKESGDDSRVFVFGDSRSAMLDEEYFREKTLNLSAVSNTITYSKLLLDKIYEFTEARPAIVFIMLGANNYNRNSVFTRRDYAITQVASIMDLLKLMRFDGGIEYAIDGLIGKLFPVYGRRMEIRSPRGLFSKFREVLGENLTVDNNNEDVLEREKPIKKIDHAEQFKMAFIPVVRRPTFDTNYYLTYKRSIYVDFAISRMHATLLENVIDLARSHGARVFLIQLPIERKLLDLQQVMVGEEFDIYLDELAKQNDVSRLDFRGSTKYEFIDINHLSPKGSYMLIKEVINPIISSI